MLETNQTIIKHKLGLLNLAEELGNVSKACKVMGLSRDTFYRYKAAVDEGGVEALFDKTRRKPNFKNRVDEEIEDAVVAYAVEQPAYGQVSVSNELRRRGTFVSPSGVRSIWIRHDLHNFKLRLRALETQVAETGAVLTEAQVVALERKRLELRVDGFMQSCGRACLPEMCRRKALVSSRRHSGCYGRYAQQRVIRSIVRLTMRCLL